MKRIYTIVLFIFSVSSLTGQIGDYFLGIERYPFIHYDENKIIFPGNNQKFERFYHKLDSLVIFGKGKINIVHIGGSHIQADIYTHQIRKHFQAMQYDMNGGRGLVFPYRIAKTNNPWNYMVNYSGSWEFCKNTQRDRICPLGLNGYAVITKSKYASIIIDPNIQKDIPYRFNQVKVFHSPTNYQIFVSKNDSLYSGIYDSIGGYSNFIIPESGNLKLKFIRNDSNPKPLTVYGISLDNDNPGLIYHAIGVNGAKLSSYLESELFSQHLTTVEPDLIIFSIGTNDANTRSFNYEKYRIEYERLIEISKIAAPNSDILITVPNDCYYYKRHVNKNTPIMRKQIMDIAKKNSYGVWDLYSVMGGLNSSQIWYNYGLMKYDRVHFNKDGYILKGNLLLTALLQGWERELATRIDLYLSKLKITAEYFQDQAIGE